MYEMVLRYVFQIVRSEDRGILANGDLKYHCFVRSVKFFILTIAFNGKREW